MQGLTLPYIHYKYKRKNEPSAKYPHGFVEKGHVYVYPTTFGLNYYYKGKRTSHEIEYLSMKSDRSSRSDYSDQSYYTLTNSSKSNGHKKIYHHEDVYGILSRYNHQEGYTYHYLDDQGECHHGVVETDHSVTIMTGTGLVGRYSSGHHEIVTTYNHHNGYYVETQSIDGNTLSITEYWYINRFDHDDPEVLGLIHYYYKEHKSAADPYAQYKYNKGINQESWLIFIILVVIIIFILIWIFWQGLLSKSVLPKIST